MRVITHERTLSGRDEQFVVVPVGDVHLGHVACDEDRLKSTFDLIAAHPNWFWIGMGDYCDFVSMSDPRFSTGALAKWVQVAHVSDLIKAQRDRFLSFAKPVAHKCLGLVGGNHESSILRHYDRNVYGEIVEALTEHGKQASLRLDYVGWVNLVFRRDSGESTSSRKGGTTTINIKAHHGSGGGKFAGSKANAMQRLLQTCSADIVLVGHTHDVRWQPEGYEDMVRGKVVHKTRFGIQTGTYLRSTVANEDPTYAETAQFPPQGQADIRIILTPGMETTEGRIQLIGTSL